MGKTRIIAIFTTRGDVGGFLSYPYIFNRDGEWIGWVNEQKQVYSVHGHYVGWLSSDPRILRKQSSGYLKPIHDPPPHPNHLSPPASLPLAPMMAELPIGVNDVLGERPELMPAVDFGDLRDDMD